MNKEDVELSVVIISHNQKEDLRRCIESVLNQITDYTFEVIVSDDRSNDGTRQMLQDEYGDRVITTYFNSDDYQTSYVLERAALNRINGLKKARGKYLMHFDGDDFLIGTDLFQSMVCMLESHPECSLCCQNYYIKPNNRLNEDFPPAKPMEIFKNGRVLTGVEFIEQVGIGHNSCFCMRRCNNTEPSKLSSTTYDDLDITLRYMQEGAVVLVDKCNFVYVNYTNSSCSTISLQEKKIMFQSNILGILLAPSLAGVLLKKYIGSVARIAAVAMTSKKFPSRLVQYCRKFDLRIYKELNENMKLANRMKFLPLLIVAGIMKVLPFTKPLLVKKVYKLAINKSITDDVIL